MLKPSQSLFKKEEACLLRRSMEGFPKIRASKRASIVHDKRKTKRAEYKLRIRASKRASVLRDKRKTKSAEYELRMQNILNTVPDIAHDISSIDPILRDAAIHKIHFIIVVLSTEHGPFYSEVSKDKAATATQDLVQRGIIHHLLWILETCEDYSQLTQIYAADVLLQLVKKSPEQAQEIIDQGGAVTIVALLRSNQNRVKVQALRIIFGITCCTSKESRDALLHHGAAIQIEALLRPLIVELPMLDDAHKTLFWNGAKALPGLCSGKPHPAFHQVEILIPIVRTIILNNNPIGTYSSQNSSYAVLALIHILELLRTDQLQLQKIVDAELCHRLVWLMRSKNTTLVRCVQGVARTLISISKAYVQVLINHGILPALLLNLCKGPTNQWIACNVIYSMIYNNQDRVQILFEGKFMHPLLQIIRNGSGRIDVKLNAVNVLSEAARVASDVHINLIVKLGCIRPLCEYLNNVKTRSICIRGLRNIIAKDARRYAYLVNQFGGDTLRALQRDNEVGATARWIVTKLTS